MAIRETGDPLECREKLDRPGQEETRDQLDSGDLTVQGELKEKRVILAI